MEEPTMPARPDDAESAPRRNVGRRAVIQAGAAAWTAPVILTATAAPAFAVSGGAITVSKGSTAVVSSGEFYDVQCSSLSITCTTSIPANTLVLTVTFAPKVDGGDPLIYKQAANPTAGWVGPSDGTPTTTNSLSYTYTGAVSAGVPVLFPNGVYFGTNVLADTNEGEGIFTLTGSATGKTPGSATLPTPHFSGPRPADRPTTGAARLRLRAPAESRD